MAAGSKRFELVAEIVNLRRQQLEAFTNATLTGWTGEQEAAHRKRSADISSLIAELEAIDGPAESGA